MSNDLPKIGKTASDKSGVGHFEGYRKRGDGDKDTSTIIEFLTV